MYKKILISLYLSSILLINTSLSQSSDPQFVFATDDPRADHIVIALKNYVIGEGYTAIALTKEDESETIITIDLFKDYLLNQNVIGVGFIGWGLDDRIQICDDFLTSGWIDGLNPHALDSKIIFFNACHVANENAPMHRSIMAKGADCFIGGIGFIDPYDTPPIMSQYWHYVISNSNPVKTRDAFDMISSVHHRFFGVNRYIFITVPTILIVRPQEGEFLETGSDYLIFWKSYNFGPTETVNIDYSPKYDNWQNPQLIADAIDNSGTYLWELTVEPSSQCQIRVQDSEDGDPTATRRGFAIFEASINVTYPTTVTDIEEQTQITIEWDWDPDNLPTSYYDNHPVRIEWKLGVGNWTPYPDPATPVLNPGGVGSTNWTVPEVSEPTTCTIRISDWEDGEPISEVIFQVYPSEGLYILRPNGYEFWPVGGDRWIKWTTNEGNHVKLEWSPTGTAPWKEIEGSYPDNGDYLWSPIPDEPSTQCKVRITDLSGVNPVDESDNYFTIYRPVALNPSILYFGLKLDSLYFTVSNPWDGSLDWHASCAADWVGEIIPSSGTLEGGNSTSVLVVVDRSGINDGYYETQIAVNRNYIDIRMQKGIPGGPWENVDIGEPEEQGYFYYTDSTFYVSGCGSDIWGTEDEFHYVYMPIEDDVEFIARVASFDGWNIPWSPNAKAGLMIRANLAEGSKNAMMCVLGDNGTVFQYRTVSNGTSAHSPGNGSVPRWIRLIRLGDTFAGFVSNNRIDWTQVGTMDITMSDTVYVGFAITRTHDDRELCTGAFDNVTINEDYSGEPIGGWMSQDIGNPGLPGYFGLSDGEFRIHASGEDIWGTSDEFHYVYKPVNGNTEMRARIKYQEDTGSRAKTGVMIRETLNDDSKHALMAITPNHGTTFVRRPQTGGTSVSATPEDGQQPPQYLRLVRYEDFFTAYRSVDGETWFQVGETVTIPMDSSVYAGLAVSSIDNYEICTVIADSVKILGSEPPWVVLYAINTGGSAHTSVVDSIEYIADAYFTGYGWTENRNHAISGTEDDVLYHSSRVGLFGYKLPIDNGTYDVTFKFAETYFSSGGNRIFNVKLEGTQFITDLDVFAEVGQDAAYDETHTVTVSDGELTINFTITENNPIVSAILVKSQEPVFPPTAPANFTASVLSSTQIDLSWADQSMDEDGFRIERSTDGGSTYPDVFMIAADDTSYSDTNLEPNTMYTYRIYAYRGSTNSIYAGPVSATTDPAPASIVVYAINAGGSSYTTVDSIEYDADAYFVGSGWTENRNHQISGTEDDTLYHSSRVGLFSYKFPVDSGTYDVTFKFAETYFSSGGNRIFNVKLEGTQYITDLDVCAEVGQDAAYDETDTVTVSDGELTINFTITENNPIVSAILVESQGGAGSSANPGDLEQDAQVVKIPDEFDLHQNYPNPFNPETTIQYDLPQAEHVILKIYDLLGREVTTLLDREMEAGYHKVTWSARDNYSNPVSTGIYIVRVVAGDFIAVKKMLLMK